MQIDTVCVVCRLAGYSAPWLRVALEQLEHNDRASSRALALKSSSPEVARPLRKQLADLVLGDLATERYFADDAELRAKGGALLASQQTGIGFGRESLVCGIG